VEFARNAGFASPSPRGDDGYSHRTTRIREPQPQHPHRTDTNAARRPDPHDDPVPDSDTFDHDDERLN